MDGSGRNPLGVQKVGRCLDREDKRLMLTRYAYRSEGPKNSPFCNKCNREGPSLMFPCSMKVRLALKRIAREHSLSMRYVEVPQPGEEALPGDITLMAPLCMHGKKTGTQIGESAVGPTASRYCCQSTCSIHMTAWVDAMAPSQSAPSTAEPIRVLHVTCGNCYSAYSHGQGLRNGRTAVESDLNPEAAAELREAWQNMWRPVVGEGPPPVHYTALLGVKAEELNLPQLTFGEQYEMLKDLTLQENAKQSAAKAKADREEGQRILNSSKARPMPKPSPLPNLAGGDSHSEPQPRAEAPKENREAEASEANGNSDDSDSSRKATTADQPRAGPTRQAKKDESESEAAQPEDKPHKKRKDKEHRSAGRKKKDRKSKMEKAEKKKDRGEKKKVKETKMEERKKRKTEQAEKERSEEETAGGSKPFDLDNEIRSKGTVLASGAEGPSPEQPEEARAREAPTEAQDPVLLEGVPPKLLMGKATHRMKELSEAVQSCSSVARFQDEGMFVYLRCPAAECKFQRFEAAKEEYFTFSEESVAQWLQHLNSKSGSGTHWDSSKVDRLWDQCNDRVSLMLAIEKPSGAAGGSSKDQGKADQAGPERGEAPGGNRESAPPPEPAGRPSYLEVVLKYASLKGESKPEKYQMEGVSVIAKEVWHHLHRATSKPPTVREVEHVSHLAGIELSAEEEQEMRDVFSETYTFRPGPLRIWPWEDRFLRKPPLSEGKKDEKKAKEKPGGPRSKWIEAAREKRKTARENYISNIDEAIEEAKQRESTAKSRATTQSRLRTWDMVLEDAAKAGKLQRPNPSDKLTKEVVLVVMAYFIKSRYRTANLYLSDAFQRHKRRHEVGAPLLAQIKASERAAMRGLGPPDRKDPLDFPDLVQLADTPKLSCIAVWYLMREDEVSSANLDWVIQSSLGKIGLDFQSRKADQEIGFRAFRDCICQGKSSRSWWCPACALKAQLAERKAFLTRQGVDPNSQASQPLFVGAGGGRIRKDEVITGVERIAARQGIALRKANGKNRFGGHTYRITGAVFAFMTGATEQEVCDLGGWKSVESMRKYLRGVPFSKTATLANRMADAVDGGPGPTCRQAALVQEEQPRADPGSTTDGDFWRNTTNGALHKVGRPGRLGCGQPVTAAMVRVRMPRAGFTAEELCNRPGCWHQRHPETSRAKREEAGKTARRIAEAKANNKKRIRRMVGLR